MSALDTATIPGPGGNVRLVLDRTNAVRVAAEGGRVTGELLRVQDDGGGGITVVPENGTRKQAR
jgi:hypothetical protein